MKWRRSAALILLLAILSGCGSTETEPVGSASGSGQVTGQAAAVEAVDTFSLAYNTSDGLDPLSCTSSENKLIVQLCFESLFVLDSNFSPQKLLCDSLEQTGKKAYTLTIRSGIKFHSGQEITVADVVYSLNNARLREDSIYQDQLACISSIKYNGDEIHIQLSKETGDLAALLDVPIFRKGTEEDDCPDGSGPYQMVKGASPSLIPFEQWSGGTVGFCSSISLVNISDNSGAANLLSSGDVSMIMLTDAEDSAVQGAKYTDSVPTTCLHYLGINCDVKPLNKADVRTALSLLLDRDTIVETCFAGRADAAAVPVNPAPKDIDLPAYNKEKALELLRQAGVYDRNGDGYLDYSSSQQFTLEIIYNTKYSTKGAVLEQYAKLLNEAGIQTTVTPLEFEECQSKLRREAFQLYYGEYTMTADFDLSSLISSSGTRNFSGYYNSDMEDALKNFSSSTDASRDAARKEYLTCFLEETPLIPLAFERKQIASSDKFPQQFDPWPDQIFHSIETWSAS